MDPSLSLAVQTVATVLPVDVHFYPLTGARVSIGVCAEGVRICNVNLTKNVFSF